MPYALIDKKDQNNKWFFNNDLQFKRSLLKTHLPIDTVNIVFSSELLRTLITQMRQFDAKLGVFTRTQQINVSMFKLSDNQVETKFLKYAQIMVDWINHRLEFVKTLSEAFQYDLAIWFSITLSAVQLGDLHAIRIKMRSIQPSVRK